MSSMHNDDILRSWAGELSQIADAGLEKREREITDGESRVNPDTHRTIWEGHHE